MFFTSLSRIIKYGALNFWRNKSISSAAISVLSLTLIIITGIWVLSIVAQTLLKGIEAKVDISAAFKPNVAEADIFKVQGALQKLDEVGGVEYVSQNQALQDFQARHKADEVISKSLEEVGTNPFGATLNVKAKNPSDPSQFEKIARFLGQDIYTPLIDKVNYFDNKKIIEKLSSIIATARKTGVALSLILIVIAMLVGFTTIRLSIYTTRDRITIMRLVGSSNWFIRGPIIVENALNGVAAALITSAVYLAGLSAISPKLSAFFAGPDISLNVFAAYQQNFWQFLLLQIVVGVGLGVISSLIAMRRYLKV